MKLKAIVSLATVFGLYQTNAQASTQHFHKIMTVVFENTNYRPTIRQDFFASFAAKGALLSNFHAEAHPSQGNYISMITGSNYGVKDDGVTTVNAKNIVDILEEKGLTWRVYVEGYPGNCFLGNTGSYVRKHNPFISMADIQSNPKRCANIVNSDQLDDDIANNQIADYSFYVPDEEDDGHNTGVVFANMWFKIKFGPLLRNAKFMKGMAVVATFDESSIFGFNQVYTAIVGEGVSPGSESLTWYNHYSLLRMIEDNYSLNSLGKFDAEATSVRDIWLNP